jgi:S-DNA-T family DNA segregation ATPase FtsK/SpoIIIE
MYLVYQDGKASASLIQRRLSVGYARAARILDQLEAAGIVGQQQGSKPREILARQTTAPQSEESLNLEEDMHM